LTVGVVLLSRLRPACHQDQADIVVVSGEEPTDGLRLGAWTYKPPRPPAASQYRPWHSRVAIDTELAVVGRATRVVDDVHLQPGLGAGDAGEQGHRRQRVGPRPPARRTGGTPAGGSLSRAPIVPGTMS